MTKDTGPPFDDQLDSYVDGMLSAEETAAFDAKLAEDATMKAALQKQRDIDESLARIYEPPPGAMERALKDIDRHVDTSPSHSAPVIPIYRRPWAAAAGILIVAGAAWQLVGILLTGGDDVDKYGPKPLTTADAFYRQTVDSGFTPDWVCKDDEEFASTFRKRFRQPLLLAQETGPVASVGLSYLNWLSTRTTALLAHVDGQPVVVLIDRIRNDKTESLPASSGLNLFRREVGKLVLYEVTPLPEPHVMDLFYNPEKDTAPAP